MTLYETILADLKSRSKTDSVLNNLIVSGNDAGVAEYYNTTDLPIEEVTEQVPEYQETRLSKLTIMQKLGDINAGVLLAGLRTYGAGEGVNASVVHEAVVELDAGRLSPNLGSSNVRTILTTLGSLGLFGETTQDSINLVSALLLLAPKTKLCHLVAGRSLGAIDISISLQPVRVEQTIALINGWNQEGEE